mmetsp:Transcript_84694/g.229503  ORF Transcript_84694/g.229503 Transcript_84694/m.229503 type:complete len:184 (-) Transcript_84694:69-620(-)
MTPGTRALVLAPTPPVPRAWPAASGAGAGAEPPTRIYNHIGDLQRDASWRLPASELLTRAQLESIFPMGAPDSFREGQPPPPHLPTTASASSLLHAASSSPAASVKHSVRIDGPASPASAAALPAAPSTGSVKHSPPVEFSGSPAVAAAAGERAGAAGAPKVAKKKKSKEKAKAKKGRKAFCC